MMTPLMIPTPQPLTASDQLTTLVENRSVITLNRCELNVFETHQQSENVRLRFSELTFTTMLRGKKKMRVFGNDTFDYIPGESVIVPQNQEMVIDFPEASLDNPTQCIALVIDQHKVQETIDILNETYPKPEKNEEWQLRHDEYHLANTLSLVQTVNRLVAITQEQLIAKDILADYALRELLIRLMQTQARTMILKHYPRYATTHRFAAVVQYIQEHLMEALTIDQLSKIAYMSKSHFFRSFKMEFGISPVEFIIVERLTLAKKLLSNPALSIADIAFRVGFNSIHYFSEQFRKHTGITASAYRRHIVHPTREQIVL
jgi:AraC-like DNA-binding protein